MSAGQMVPQCNGECSYKARSDHDELLTILDNPDILIGILQDFALIEECDRDDDVVPLSDLEDFISDHNWSSPAQAKYLACSLGQVYTTCWAAVSNETRAEISEERRQRQIRR